MATIEAEANRAGVAASLDITLGRLADAIDRLHRGQDGNGREFDRGVSYASLPAVQFPVTAGTLIQPVGAQSLLGPEDGQVWDIRRISLVGLQAAPAQDGTSVSGSVTNPGATTNIVATAASLAPGYYLVNWTVGLQGTVTAADASNMRLQFSTGTNIVVAQFPGVVGNYPMPQVVRLLTSGGFRVQSIAAASGVSAIYTAQIAVQPVTLTQGADQVSLYREVLGGGGNPQNFLWTFTPPGSSPGPAWNPGGGLLLRSPETLMLTGTSLGATAVTLNMEGNIIESRYLSRYLL